MELTPLTAISPVDGRYRKHVQHLDEYFSEYALIKYRVLVEIEYFFFFFVLKFFKLSHKAIKHLKKLQEDFGLEDAQEKKQIEYTTNHDVKAIEYFLKNELEKSGGMQVKEWIHFGLTSQDINNTAIPLLWKHAIEYEYLPSLLNLNAQLKLLAREWKDIPMLAHTHGQPASPTKMDTKIMVCTERREKQTEHVNNTHSTAKAREATGNVNTHHPA